VICDVLSIVDISQKTATRLLPISLFSPSTLITIFLFQHDVVTDFCIMLVEANREHRLSSHVDESMGTL